MLRDELKSRDGLLSDPKDENKKLSTEINKLKNHLNDMKTANRRDNLTFTGIRIPYADVVASQKPAEKADRQTAPSSTVLLNQVVDICNILKVPIKVEDISATYMLSKGSSTASPVNGVKFVRRTIRDNVYFTKKKIFNFTDDKIYINEDLPLETRRLVASLHQIVKNKTLHSV